MMATISKDDLVMWLQVPNYVSQIAVKYIFLDLNSMNHPVLLNGQADPLKTMLLLSYPKLSRNCKIFHLINITISSCQWTENPLTKKFNYSASKL